MNKYLYSLSIIPLFLQFVLIWTIHNISLYELGIFSILNGTIFILIQTAKFDGAYLFISNMINKDQLFLWSKTTNSFVLIITLLIGTYLFSSSYLICLSLLMINIINLYIFWFIDLNNVEKRIKSNYNKIYKKDVIIYQYLPRAFLQILLILILNNLIQKPIFLTIFIFFELIILILISYFLIGLNLNIKNISFPPIRFNLNILLDNLEDTLLVFGLGLITGLYNLGNFQLIITF